jgi:hypothetical protein
MMCGIGSRIDDYGNWVIDTYESCKVIPQRVEVITSALSLKV